MTRLKELRQERKFTQQYVSEKLSITRGAYANIENGVREPDNDTLRFLSQMYSVSIDYLLGMSDLPNPKENSNMTNLLSFRIKELRESKNLTQGAFATKFEISPSTIAMWESRKREPDFDTLNKLASFFDVSVDYLIGYTNQPNPRVSWSDTFVEDYWNCNDKKRLSIIETEGIDPRVKANAHRLLEEFSIPLNDKAITEEEESFIDLYRGLNEQGRAYMAQQIKFALAQPEYQTVVFIDKAE